MSEVKRVKIKVRTPNCVYVGELVIPPMRKRVSDVLNEDSNLFINLSDVVINGDERAEFIALNKNMIVSITEL